MTSYYRVCSWKLLLVLVCFPALINAQGSSPYITTATPGTIEAGHATFTLGTKGSSFGSDAVVQWNGAALSATVVSTTQINATVPAALVVAAGAAFNISGSGFANAPPWHRDCPGQHGIAPRNCG